MAKETKEVKKTSSKKETKVETTTPKKEKKVETTTSKKERKTVNKEIPTMVEEKVEVKPEVKLFNSVDTEETISFTFKKPFFFFIVLPLFFFAGLFLFLTSLMFAKNNYQLRSELENSYSINNDLSNKVVTLDNINVKNEIKIRNMQEMLKRVAINFDNMYNVVNTAKSQLSATANSISALEEMIKDPLMENQGTVNAENEENVINELPTNQENVVNYLN
jgi:hypothetical protein